MGIIRKWDVADKETRDKCINEIISRVEDIGDDAVGIIAAQDIIDIVTETLGPEIYNKAIRDAKKVLEHHMDDVDIELDALKVKA